MNLQRTNNQKTEKGTESTTEEKYMEPDDGASMEE